MSSATSYRPQKKEKDVVYGWMHIPTVMVTSKSRKGIYRNTTRLERMIKKVYPIAMRANSTLLLMEREMMLLKSDSERRKYVKSVEKKLKKEFTPALRTMTTSEGIVLLKLIDRETGDSSYKLVKELRGGFSAFFWQGIARLFSVNLKMEYDEFGDDRIIEYYIQQYERDNR